VRHGIKEKTEEGEEAEIVHAQSISHLNCFVAKMLLA
jgi:hypothetical protein